MAIVASPEYLRSAGTPDGAADLPGHSCLRLRRSSGLIASWRLIEDRKPIEVVVNGPLIANDFPTLVGAACDGLGLAQVPAPVAQNGIDAGRLVSVLPRLAPMTPGVFLYHPGRRQVLPKLRAFIEHIKAANGRLLDP